MTAVKNMAIVMNKGVIGNCLKSMAIIVNNMVVGECGEKHGDYDEQGGNWQL